MTTFEVGSASDVGQVRSNNQDSKLVADQVSVFAVADGMGGHQGGEVASAIAVETLGDTLDAPTTESLVESVHEANRRIYQRATDSDDLRGMGTTLVAIALVDQGGESEEVAWVNVGDSRVYLLRSGELHQLSRDHSLVEDLRRGGQLSDEEAAVHPQRNILTRALGIDSGVDVDHGAVEPWVGDRFLLCSDGLFNEVDRPTLIATLEEVDDPEAAAHELVRLANAGGGRDNITCIVADVTDDGGRAQRAEEAAAAQQAAAASRASAGVAPVVDETLQAGQDAPTAEMPAVTVPDSEVLGQPDTDATLVGEVPPEPTGPGLVTPPIPGPPPAPAAAGDQPGPETADAMAAGPDVTRPSPSPAAGTVPGEGPFPTPSDPGFPTDSGPQDTGDTDDLGWGAQASGNAFEDISGGRHWAFRIVGLLVVLGVLGAAAYFGGQAYAGRKYHLATEGTNVVVYQGEPGGFLIFEPEIVQRFDNVTLDDLNAEGREAVVAKRTFDNESNARSFVNNHTQRAPEPEPEDPASTTTAPESNTTEPGSTTTTGPVTSTTAPSTTTTTAPR